MGEAFIPQEVEFYDPKNLDAIFAKENEKDEEQLRKRITTQVTLKFANFHQEEMRKIENRIQKMKEENQQLIEQKEQEMQQREERLNQYIAMIEEEKKKNEEASNQEIEELKLTSSNQLQETIEKFQREKKDTLILAAQDHRQKLEEMDKTYVQQISQLEKQIQDLGENNAQGDNRVQRLDLQMGIQLILDQIQMEIQVLILQILLLIIFHQLFLAYFPLDKLKLSLHFPLFYPLLQLNRYPLLSLDEFDIRTGRRI
ncbi:MAG: hypothetical protein EZS28_046219 [Streblomastix strix]|uniref:Uncharacterized protein n=1 Tax=Streblomastix strix TaxID=222440 RepID=A0A5J4TIN1_9EUKA|nr:MAG: hypothetical protein EZS28_046219 [Streblomastix strix]